MEENQGMKFDYTTEEFLSIRFLELFLQKYDELIKAIGNYIARFHILNASFLSSELTAEKEELVKIIKSNLAPVIYQLEAIAQNSKTKSEVNEKINKLKEILDEITHLNEIPLDMLFTLNQNLSYIVSILFLTPIMHKIPSKKTRILGSYELEDEDYE